MKTITKEQEEFLDECTYRTWKLNTETGLVDVAGDFNCSSMGLSDFLGIEFGIIKRRFDCSHNRLVSLEGAPQKVDQVFSCSNNQLTSLEGSPKEVGWRFYCYNNKLVSLEDAPQKVLGDFICDPINLRGCPINLLNKIYFYNHKKNKIDEYLIKIINTLDPYLYFKKMI